MERPLTAVVVDDNRAVHTDLIALTHEDPLLRDLTIVYCGTTIRSTLRFLKKNGPVDIVLCDIELKDENGLLEAEKFFEHTGFFLLLTVHDQFKQEAMDKGVHGYILKPASPKQIRKRLDDLKRIRRSGKIMDDPDHTMFIKDIANPEPTKVRLRDIYAITVDIKVPNVLKVDTVWGAIRHRKSLKAFGSRLSATGLFVSLGQSALVSKLHVSRITDNAVFLTNGFAYPVSERHHRAIGELRDYLDYRNRSKPDD